MVGIADYAAEVQRGKLPAINAFMLAESHINTDDDTKRHYNKVVSKHELLGNVSDDTTLRLYQNDGWLLSWALSMGIRDNRLMDLYDCLEGVFASEMKLTRVKDGLQLKLQANTGGGYNPQKEPTGYGSEIQAAMQKQQERDAQLFNSLMNRNQQQGR